MDALRVVAFSERSGGFGTGTAGVATLSNGREIFLKVEDRPAEDLLAGARVAGELPPEVPTPRMLGLHYDIDPVVVYYDVAPGKLPHEPWRPHELAAALDLIATCARILTPTPIKGLPTVAARMAARGELWNVLDQHPGVQPGPWELAHLERLAEIERAWTDLVVGDTLLHFDPRYDNILIDADGTARFVDWGRACIGPAWVDLVCLLLQSDLGPRDPEEVFTGHPLGAAAPPAAVDAMLVALAGYWTRTAVLPGRLRERRERSRQATIGWLRARWTSDSYKRGRSDPG